MLMYAGFSMSFGIGHRNSCLPSKAPPPGRVDTSRQLRELRTRLKAMALDAFIITRDDGHQVSFEISGTHGTKYEDYSLLGYSAVWSHSSRPKFQMYIFHHYCSDSYMALHPRNCHLYQIS
jgi:hypothetical protein